MHVVGRTILAAGLVFLAAAGAQAGQLDEGLRKEIQGLNDRVMLGQDDEEQLRWCRKQVDALAKDADHAKRLAAAAGKLADQEPAPLTFTGAYLLGMLAKDLQDYPLSQKLYRVSLTRAAQLQSVRKQAMVYLELVDLLVEAKDFAGAEKVCREFLELRADADTSVTQMLTLFQLVKILAWQGNTEQAFKVLEAQVKANGDDQNPFRLPTLRTKAWLLQFTGKYQEAAKIYEEILDEIRQAANRQAAQEYEVTLREEMAGLFSDAGEVAKAEEHLRWLLKQKPDEPRYNNGLGYLLADHDRNLEEAEKLLVKALAQEPTTPAYLDSMGWVLYRQKKYREAKEYLQKAVADPAGRHAEIYDHLGDVHLALGEKAEAVKAWKLALTVLQKDYRDQQRKIGIEKKLKESGE